MNYQTIVQTIKQLNWKGLGTDELQHLMYLSYQSALEFGGALRITLNLYPTEHLLQEMAAGELKTNNLRYGDYQQTGDHAEFLEFFLNKYSLFPSPTSELAQSGKKYQEICKSLPDDVRAMTIFSREKELPGIFQNILTASNWSAPGLPEFRYYIEQHILLDSQEGGHSDMLKQFVVDDRVANFYSARLDMYRAIPTLFSLSK